jgi:hypothetical protein
VPADKFVGTFHVLCMGYIRGVDKFFKALAKLASSLVFSLAKSENNRPKI